MLARVYTASTAGKHPCCGAWVPTRHTPHASRVCLLLLLALNTRYVSTVEAAGATDNTIFIVTSDHGGCMHRVGAGCWDLQQPQTATDTPHRHTDTQTHRHTDTQKHACACAYCATATVATAATTTKTTTPIHTSARVYTALGLHPIFSSPSGPFNRKCGESVPQFDAAQLLIGSCSFLYPAPCTLHPGGVLFWVVSPP